MTGRRIGGLEGLRGLTAFYVVLHHCWLLAFPGYPADTGPVWLGWLLYGRLAVVIFIVLSGFSLAARPARDGWQLGGLARYARRRCRRILVPYWVALAVSMLVAWAAAPLPLAHIPSVRSALVYGLMLQDVVAAPAPNGAFWSIAVEAVLYVAFPLLLLVRRWAGAAAVLAVSFLPVAVFGPATATGYVREMAPLFTMGLIAAGIRSRHFVWTAFSAVPVALTIVAQGSTWTVRHYFWIDLAVGPAISAALVAVAIKPPSLLETWPLRSLGRCSYSLYLIHMPIVALINRRLVTPHTTPGLPRLAWTLAIAVPALITVALLLAALFERRPARVRILGPGRQDEAAETPPGRRAQQASEYRTH